MVKIILLIDDNERCRSLPRLSAVKMIGESAGTPIMTHRFSFISETTNEVGMITRFFIAS